jgi:DNA-damage-inducible protein J
MAMTSVNVRMDSDDKRRFDLFCNQLGLNMSSAINIVVKYTLRENKLPVELKADPFYSDVNMKYVNKGIRDYEEGRFAKITTIEALEAELGE